MSSKSNTSTLAQQEPVSLDKVEAVIVHRSSPSPIRETSNTSRRNYLIVGLTLLSITLLALVIWLGVDRPSEPPSLEACVDMRPYPGYGGEIKVSGRVCLRTSGEGYVYHYDFHHLPRKSQGGWHVHSGTTCQDSGGHFQGGLTYDPWKGIIWKSDRLGRAKSNLDMSFTPLNVLGRTIVVHSPDGVRIACGEIPGEPHQHTVTPTMSPTQLPTGDPNCQDSRDFTDTNGNHCQDWIGYNCQLANSYIKFGRKKDRQPNLTPKAKNDLLENCPASCGLCYPSQPARVPDELCHDNEAYRTEDDERCHDWLGYNCYFAALEYDAMSFNGQMDLLANCPASCGLCNPLPQHPTDIPPNQCRDDPSWVEDDDNACMNLIGTNCYQAAFMYDDDDITFNEQKDIIKNCPASCGLCLQEPPKPVAPEKCIDNDAFRDEANNKCHDWLGYNCHQSALDDEDISFNGQIALIQNCPASCGLCVPEVPKPKVCRDNRHFRDEDGNACRHWKGYQCKTLAATQDISFKQQNAILKNCPATCRLCKPLPCSLTNESIIDC